MNELKGLKVAILITDGFEQVEMVKRGRRSLQLAPRPVLCHPRMMRSEAGSSRNGVINFRLINR